MALIHCSECGAEISDKAPTCPKCGNPQPEAQDAVPVGSPPQARTGSGWLKWVFIVPICLFGVVMCGGFLADPNGEQAAKRAANERRECVTALASSMNHSTTGYADQAAYDARVKDKCSGYTINGDVLGK